MKYRKLRIAWSVVWGLASVLLVVLWIRSFWEIDKYSKQPSNANGFTLLSRNGAVYCAISRSKEIAMAMDLDVTWRFILAEIAVAEAEAKRGSSRRFVISNDSMLTVVRVPDLCLLGLTTALVAAPWLRWRFTLRTLLIATMLIAVALGATMYSVR